MPNSQWNEYDVSVGDGGCGNMDIIMIMYFMCKVFSIQMCREIFCMEIFYALTFLVTGYRLDENQTVET